MGVRRPLARQMQRGDYDAALLRAIVVRLHGLRRRLIDHLNPGLPEVGECLVGHAHYAVCSLAYHEDFGGSLENGGKIFRDECVPVLPPPVGHDARWKDDHVGCIRFTVDLNLAERVRVDDGLPSHDEAPLANHFA